MLSSSVTELFVSGIILLVLDFGYIFAINRPFRSQIFAVQHSPMNVRYFGAVVTYAFVILGLYYFIIRNHRSILDAFLLGIFVYGVYDFTNYATIREWRPELAVVDTLWGGTLFGVTTFFTYKMLNVIK